MWVCILCSRRVSDEDAPYRLMLLTVCLRCIDVAAAGGITITAESAQELMKRAIASGPLPERVSDEEAQHLRGATCSICKWETPADDVVLLGKVTGFCICLRCYHRETSSEAPLPKKLRESIIAILAEVEG